MTDSSRPSRDIGTIDRVRNSWRCPKAASRNAIHPPRSRGDPGQRPGRYAPLLGAGGDAGPGGIPRLGKWPMNSPEPDVAGSTAGPDESGPDLIRPHREEDHQGVVVDRLDQVVVEARLLRAAEVLGLAVAGHRDDERAPGSTPPSGAAWPPRSRPCPAGRYRGARFRAGGRGPLRWRPCRRGPPGRRGRGASGAWKGPVALSMLSSTTSTRELWRATRGSVPRRPGLPGRPAPPGRAAGR